MDDRINRNAESIIEAVFEGTARVTGKGFFLELVRCLCDLLDMRYAFVGELASGDTINTVAVWANGRIAESFQYDLDGTPCADVITNDTCIHSESVQTLFPADTLLVSMDVESYLGTPLRDSTGDISGLLVVLDDKPMTDGPLLKRVLEVFAARAGAELGRRNAERNRRRYEQIISATEDMMAYLDADLVYRAVNDAYLRTHGKKREEIVGHSVRALMGDEVFKRTLAPQLDRCLTGQEIRYEAWFDYALRGRRFAEVTYYPARSSDGEVIGVVVCIHDITEHRQVEEDLRRSEALFTAAFDSSPSLMSISTLDEGRLLAVNDAFCRVLEYDRTELIGRTSTELELYTNNQDRQEFRRRIQRDSWVSGMEIRVRAKSSEEKIVLVGGSIIDAHGQTCLLVSAEDITARKRTEAALEKRIVALTQPLSEAGSINFEDLFNLDDVQRLQDEFADATGVASIITQIDGTPITRPSNFCRLCRDVIRRTEKGCANCFKSDAALGRFHPGGPLVQTCLSGGLWDAGTSISVGGRHIANWLIGQVRDETQTDEKMRAYAREIGADEEELISAFNEVPAMSREQFGRVAQALFTVANQLSNSAYQNIQQARFISERKLAMEAREKLEDQLRQVQKMEAVGQLAGGVAHDFNNILQAVLGYAEMAVGAADQGLPVQDHLQEILRASHRAKTLVGQLLAFSRRQVLDMEPLDLNEVIGELLKMLRRIIGEHIVLEFLPGHNLGIIRADRGQIGQILTNLCVNARDAMPDGGTVTIEMENVRVDEAYCQTHTWAQPGRYVQLSVTDTGMGMEAGMLDHIFEPFFTTKDMSQGTGLGLATVYGLVKQHGGQVEVYSEPDLGTTFKIYFPIVERSAVLVGDKIEGPLIGGNETILLAEDDELVLGVAQAFLEGAGYTVLTARDGAQAVEVFKAHAKVIDLILLDVVMPEMGGRTASNQIHSLRPDVPTLYCSGYSTNAVHTNFILEQGLSLIQKPYQRADLLRKVRETLDEPQKRVPEQS